VNAALRETLSPARRDCGSLSVRLNGERALLRCSGALWLIEHRTLIAADLHLEKGSAFARRGQMLPPYDSRATMARLAEEVAMLKPERVVLLGDSFHDRTSIQRLGEDERALLAVLAEGRDWIWLEGNHDREALGADLDALPGRIVGDMALGALELTHEPHPGLRPGEVAGHLHPCAVVAAYARSVRRPCFLTDGRRAILPAFGAFTGGLNARDVAFAGLFEHPPMAAALGRDRVHALSFDRLL
jgi:uncharacterized protein